MLPTRKELALYFLSIYTERGEGNTSYASCFKLKGQHNIDGPRVSEGETLLKYFLR